MRSKSGGSSGLSITSEARDPPQHQRNVLPPLTTGETPLVSLNQPWHDSASTAPQANSMAWGGGFPLIRGCQSHLRPPRREKLLSWVEERWMRWNTNSRDWLVNVRRDSNYRCSNQGHERVLARWWRTPQPFMAPPVACCLHTGQGLLHPGK